MLRLTRWKYRCGDCQHAYVLPGADLSFFYGWFLGVSPNLEAVVFDTVTYQGFDEIQEIIGALADETRDEHPGLRTSEVLSEVSDRDNRGERYSFAATPGCPVCASMKVATFSETQEPWPHAASEATHVVWDGMSHQAKVLRVRVALGLDRHERRG